MHMIRAMRLAMVVLGPPLSVAAADDLPLMAKIEVGLSFTNSGASSQFARLGTAYSTGPHQVESSINLPPLAGISYTSSSGFAPVVLGATLASAQGDAEGGGGNWGWWAAGAGVAIAAALASSSGSDTKVNEEDGNVTECGVGDNGGVLPDIDLNCLP